MTDLFVEPDDATLLEPEERDGLLQSWITTRADLNAAEQDNIDVGAAWAYRRAAGGGLGTPRIRLGFKAFQLQRLNSRVS